MESHSFATRRLAFAKPASTDRLTHYLFRYPAKFHPPVVKELLRQYTKEGDLVYDPFCGSGTLLVEAGVTGRHAVGSDVDPVAVYVTSVKAKPLGPTRLRKTLEALLVPMRRHRRSRDEYEARKWQDLSDDEFARERGRLWLPAIPNLEHWFRRYVLVDLARMLDILRRADMPETERRFFILVFASVLRAASNADPVPVSGLEVTAHMKRRDAEGRLIDPFGLWEAASTRAIRGMGEYHEAATRQSRLSAFQADAVEAARRLRRTADAVITSPPYHGAVDYYRRHQLEMYWLGLTSSHEDRLGLLQRYIGRVKVAARHPLIREQVALPRREAAVEARMRELDGPRADAFRHYCVAMGRTFEQLGRVLRTGSPALFVVGHSVWRGTSLNTTDLFAELSQPHFRLEEVLDYPVKNRYMSYARRNGASIDHEYVLALRRS